MNATSEKLKLTVIVQARVRYNIFDLSGSLPFDIFYSLARGWPIAADDPPTPLPSRYVDQPLTIRIQDSLLDVEYALKYGYLKILDEENEDTPIDFSDIELPQSRDREYITLESGAASLVRWRKRLYEVSYKIDPSSSIGQKFQPHRRYRLIFPRDSDEFPVVEFTLEGTNGDGKVPGVGAQQGPSETLAICKHASASGRNEFETFLSLPQPPQINVSLSANHNRYKVSTGEGLNLRVEITNRSDRAIIVKSKGDQNYLAPQVPMKNSTDDRPRITCPRATPGDRYRPRSPQTDIHWSNISIRKTSTGEEVVPEYFQTCKTPARGSGEARRMRIYRHEFTTLEPNILLVKEESLAKILTPRMKLEPGEYRLSLVPLGALWFWGSADEVFGENESIDEWPWPPSQTPGVMFASTDEIVYSVE